MLNLIEFTILAMDKAQIAEQRDSVKNGHGHNWERMQEFHGTWRIRRNGHQLTFQVVDVTLGADVVIRSKRWQHPVVIDQGLFTVLIWHSKEVLSWKTS